MTAYMRPVNVVSVGYGRARGSTRKHVLSISRNSDFT